MKRKITLLSLIILGIAYLIYSKIQYDNMFGERVAIHTPYTLKINVKKSLKFHSHDHSSSLKDNYAIFKSYPIKEAVTVLLKVPENRVKMPKNWNDKILSFSDL